MPQYRIYLVDKFGHVIAPPEVLHCDTDEEIIQKAKSMMDGHDIEVWNGPRVVAKIPSMD
jgi:hypothetical protein